MKSNLIESFANLCFHAMDAPNTGCIATGKLSSGYNITVTGGNVGQAATGLHDFLVEVTDTRGDETRVVTKKNMELEELSLLIFHHYKNRNRKRRYNRHQHPRHNTSRR
jgi:hypothetical protein